MNSNSLCNYDLLLAEMCLLRYSYFFYHFLVVTHNRNHFSTRIKNYGTDH